YHPDTPEIRSNWVEYYHIITKMDAQVGEWLAKLEAAGLADDTIVFYYGDNGGILPRSKRSLYDTGLHVPLLVRYGKNFAHLAPAQPGAAVDRLVSFVDLAPTVLSLAGMEIPTHMQGRAFAGPRVTAPDEFVYGYANRMDDRYDMLRSVCDGRFKYIRNYLPHLIYGQHLAYLWQMPATRSWEQAFKDGKCDATQSAFWHAKPAEELYDTQADPWEVHNLAEDAQYAQQLARLRQANRDHLLAVRDTTFLPEPMMLQRAGKDPIRSMAQDDQRYPIARVLAAAELAAGRDAAAVPKLIQLLGDPDAAVRYWAATGCAIRGRAAATAGDTLTALLKDASADVALAAADALCRLGHADLGTPLLTRYQAQLDTTVGNPEAHTRCLLARNLITAQSESPT
ncbi:MAG: sulfatase/phosphatase domain-containing protein, partial [Phycisphaeraceae bacterium]